MADYQRHPAGGGNEVAAGRRGARKAERGNEGWRGKDR